MRIRDWFIVVILLISASFCAAWGDQARRATADLPIAFEQSVPDRLTRFSLVAALGGMRRVSADWIYIESLQFSSDYIGEGFNRPDIYLNFFEEILWTDPFFHHAILEGAAVVGFHVGNVGQAIDFLRRAYKVDPMFHRYQDYIGALLYEKEDKPFEAIARLKKEILREGASESLLRIVGNIYLKHKDWKGALAYWAWMCPRVKHDLTRWQCERELPRLLKLNGKI